MRSRTSRSRSRRARSSAWSASPARASRSPRTPSWACCRRASSPSTGGRVLLEGDDLLVKSPAEMRRIRGDRIAMIFQEPMTALNPVMRVGDQIAEVLDIHTELDERERRARVLEVMQAVRLPEPERTDRRLSAPALRRPAPAHHDRGRAGARSGAADRRRADHRARRHHAGADPEADQGAARAAQHRRAVHHARLRRGRRGRAPRRGDAARPRGRAGPRPRTCCAGRATTTPAC